MDSHGFEKFKNLRIGVLFASSNWYNRALCIKITPVKVDGLEKNVLVLDKILYFRNKGQQGGATLQVGPGGLGYLPDEQDVTGINSSVSWPSLEGRIEKILY